MKQKINLLYIMSPSYSGSTLLTTLLAQRTDVATIGELKANDIPNIEEYTCSCGTRILECDYWQQLKEEVAAKGRSLDLADFATRFRSRSFLSDRVMRPNVKGNALESLRSFALKSVPSCSSEFKDILAQNRAIIESACKLQNTNNFLDASKDPLRALIFLEHEEYELKLLYLTRDGRGTVASDKRYNKLSTEDASVSWKNKILEMDRVAEKFPAANLMKLRYETLCEAPDKTLDEIISFAGFNKLPESEMRESLHILGNNNMRLVSTLEIKLDEKWKRNLSNEDIAEFESIAGDLNQSLGYTPYSPA